MVGPRLGFIGFGEASAAIALGLHEAGHNNCSAYDKMQTKPKYSNQILQRAIASKTIIKKDMASLVAGCDIIISSVTATSALRVATEVREYIQKGQFFLDINSVSPETKKKIASLFNRYEKLLFVEVAVMAALPTLKHKTPMLVCGPNVPYFIKTVKDFNFNLTDVGCEFGRASSIKMFRSIIVKGIEAVLQESMLGAYACGVSDLVLKSLQNSYPGIDWENLTSYLLGRTILHGERRAAEMREASATLEKFGIEPIISKAAADRIQIGATTMNDKNYSQKLPDHYLEILDILNSYENHITSKTKS